MNHNVLIFFPQNPIPPRSGAHQRFLEVSSGLIEMGCRVSLVSSHLVTVAPWTESAVAELRTRGFAQVRIHRPSLIDYAVAGGIVLPLRLIGRAPRFDSHAFTPPGLIRAFRRAIEEWNPDVLLINYAHWDRLVDHRGDSALRRIIDVHDVLSIQSQLRTVLGGYFPLHRRIEPDRIPADLLCEDYYDRLGLRIDPRELRVYDKYTATIAISSPEASLIRANAPNTNTVYLPVTQSVPPLTNTYDSQPVFVAGYNPYNLQGYCYLARRIMPCIRSRRVECTVRVLGPVCQYVAPSPGSDLVGYVPDLSREYQAAPFALCPVFGGTGQQIKIVEAMAHGVPVIALASAAARSPLRHEENGLVARHADEFAEQMIRLLSDRDLCRKLGQTARETILAEYSRTRLLDTLRSVLDAPVAI